MRGPGAPKWWGRTWLAASGNGFGNIQPEIVDITGGAPELSEFFRFFVETARGAGSHVIDRCNLTIIEEPGYGDLPDYLAGQEVEVIASLPCYTAENVAKQRGAGVFEKSISALRKLNGVGYGTRLPLNLVYNPVGPKAAGPAGRVGGGLQRGLGREFGITFNRLYTITNQPIARFAEDSAAAGQDRGIHVAVGEQLQPRHGRELMCRTTLSVGWMGRVYDCDFNQMLGMQMQNGKPLYLWDVTPELLEGWAVRTGAHCLACTAGCGSSCGGAFILETNAK